MSWVDLVIHSKGIKAIYGDHTPSLTGIDLHKVVFDYDRIHVTLVFDLPELPATLPAKWQKRECDVVQIEMDLIEISDLSARVWGSRTSTSIHMVESQGKLNVSVQSETGELSATADFASLQRISAYRSDVKRHR
ncbi:hypothetical protein FHX42_001695 [Saccharopolyspora lacisalsi]|uniref:Immunity protein 50 of polymorphic toxin system n=1 Tax=Halosaccharopolyspora lacisalsi TaxID=1000566 RepID=A0A839E049_9PSEU|nr:Imm50 family immunity protein [Halosaccharopolyspora lacisalsi]MBA8824348.1 hypothetical protein [Halosaccharopolyspora lacisalsi]